MLVGFRPSALLIVAVLVSALGVLFLQPRRAIMHSAHCFLVFVLLYGENGFLPGIFIQVVISVLASVISVVDPQGKSDA